MPFNGAGTYAAPANTFNPAVTNTAINSTDWNATAADLATALSLCVLKDGQQTPTANIPMGGFKLTGLAAGSATGNSLRYEQLFNTGQVALLGGLTTAGPINTVGSINETKTTVASATSPDIWTSVGNVVDYTGTVTATGFAAAPQAGARRTLICAGAAVFTAGANMLIDGIASGSNYTAVAGDQIQVTAVTTTQFRLVTPNRPFVDTYPIAIGSSDGTKKFRVEVDGFTTGNTRVLTPPDADLTLAAVTAKGDMLSASASGVLVKTAVGTDGQVWTADAASTGGAKWTGGIGLSKLTSGTVTNAATLDIVMTSFTAFPNKLLVFDLIPATDGVGFILRLSTNGGISYDATASDYTYVGNLLDDSGASLIQNITAGGGATEIQIAFNGNIGNGSAEGISGTLFFPNTTSTAKWPRVGIETNYISADATPRVVSFRGAGTRRAAQDTDALRLLFTSGNIASGSWALYGYN